MLVDAIFLAGGKGLRTKLTNPKQLYLLDNKPLLIHSLEILENTPNIDKIIVSSLPEYRLIFEELVKCYDISKAICIDGGPTRQLSVYNCLKYITTDKTLIHVSARPFITTDFINKLLSYNSDLIIPVLDVQYIIIDIKNSNYPSRNNLKYVQLPQVIKTELLISAHKYAMENKIINSADDSSLVVTYANSKNIKITNPLLVLGLEENIKITTPIDLIIAEQIYNRMKKNEKNS